MKHEIEIPDLPEGWDPVEILIDPDQYNKYVGDDGCLYWDAKIRMKKKQPLRGLHDPLRFAEGLIEQLPDDHEGAINWLMNHGEGDKAGKLREKYSHPQTRRIVLEETGNIRQSCYLLKIDDGNLILPPGREYKIADDKNETRD
jgi:hypothetical protein